MGCVSSKKVVSSSTHPSANNLPANRQVEEVPDEEAVEVAPARVQQSPEKKQPKPENEEVPAQPVIPAAPVPAVAQEAPPQEKPSFPNLEPNFDFQFLEEEKKSPKADPKHAEALDELVNDLNQE